MQPGPRGRAVVLGAGIQGVCTALALAAEGWTVELLDRAPAPMLATSLRGEGKLHLGYVYAKDEPRATAALMVEGAFSFSDLVDGWLPEPVDWSRLRSEPFLYAVLPDTMVAVDRLRRHYAWVDAALAEHSTTGSTYAGLTSVHPVRQLASPSRHGLAGDVLAAFATDEVAIDPLVLRAGLVAGLVARAVEFRGDTTVAAVERTQNGFSTRCTRDGGDVTHRSDVVVNCLWDGRLAIDATMGIEPPRPWLYRLKYAVHGSLPAGAPMPATTTFVLGPFGDVVCRANGRVYASWYPACHTASSPELTVPRTWAPALSGKDTAATQQEIASATVAALARLLPPLEELQVDTVAAGVIVAWGETDIDEPESGLHRRDAIGVHDHDGYLSVDTGKLTTAPLFAHRVAQRLVAPS